MNSPRDEEPQLAATRLRDLPLLADMSDEELIDAYRRGREAAFRELHRRYEGRLAHFIRRKTGAYERVPDILQEVWVRVSRHLHRFDADKRFSTWVYTIAANLCKNELRNRARSRMIPMRQMEPQGEGKPSPLEFPDLRMAPDRLFQKRQLQALVEDTVQELPLHQERVFRLRELKGRSYREVAEILGLNLGTVKSRLHRARTAFAESIRSGGKVESEEVSLKR